MWNPYVPIPTQQELETTNTINVEPTTLQDLVHQMDDDNTQPMELDGTIPVPENHTTTDRQVQDEDEVDDPTFIPDSSDDEQHSKPKRQRLNLSGRWPATNNKTSPYKCEICLASYHRRPHLILHLKSESHLQMARQVRFREKLNDAQPQQQQQQQAEQTPTTSTSDTSATTTTTTRSILKCELCNMLFRWPHELAFHLKTLGHLKKQNGGVLSSSLLDGLDFKYKCKLCNKVFGKRGYLQKHKQSSVFHQEMLTLYQAQQQKLQSSEKVDDPENPAPKPNTKALLSLRRTRGAQLSIKGSHKCQVCRTNYESNYEYRRHLQTQNHKLRVSIFGKGDDEKLNMEEEEEVTSYSYTVTRPRPFKCSTCSTTYSTQHKLNVHLGSKQHQAKLDEASSSSSSSNDSSPSSDDDDQEELDNCIKKITRDGLSFKCQACDTLFMYALELKLHQKSAKHLARVAQLEKAQGGDTSLSLEQIKDMLRKEKQEKKEEKRKEKQRVKEIEADCAESESESRQRRHRRFRPAPAMKPKSNLKRTKKTKTKPETNFKCSICSSSYTSAGDLRRHFTTKLHSRNARVQRRSQRVNKVKRVKKEEVKMEDEVDDDNNWSGEDESEARPAARGQQKGKRGFRRGRKEDEDHETLIKVELEEDDDVQTEQVLVEIKSELDDDDVEDQETCEIQQDDAFLQGFN